MDRIDSPHALVGRPHPTAGELLHCPSGAPGLPAAEVARRLNVDFKTLKRQLEREGSRGAEYCSETKTRYWLRVEGLEDLGARPSPTKTSADSTPAMEQRLAALEAENRDLRAEVRRLKEVARGYDIAVDGLQEALRTVFAPDSPRGL